MTISSNTSSITTGLKRTRATTHSVVQKRAAKAVTMEMERRLSEWHTQIAKLRGMAMHGGGRAADVDVRSEVNALTAEIDEHRARFTEAVRALSEQVASTSWIEDIDRALDRAAEVVRTIDWSEGRADLRA